MSVDLTHRVVWLDPLWGLKRVDDYKHLLPLPLEEVHHRLENP
jgi:hypothetical protein